MAAARAPPPPHLGITLRKRGTDKITGTFIFADLRMQPKMCSPSPLTAWYRWCVLCLVPVFGLRSREEKPLLGLARLKCRRHVAPVGPARWVALL